MIRDNCPASDNDINPNLDILNKNLYDTGKSLEYLCRNIDNLNSNMEPSYLVGRGLYKTSNAHFHIHDDDVLLHIMITNSVASLTRNEIYEFLFLMKLMSTEHTNKY